MDLKGREEWYFYSYKCLSPNPILLFAVHRGELYYSLSQFGLEGYLEDEQSSQKFGFSLRGLVRMGYLVLKTSIKGKFKWIEAANSTSFD